MGALLVVVGFLMGKDSRKDSILALGGALLLIYSVSIESAILIVLTALFTILSLVHMDKRGRRN
ncbi:MAG: hypothetical protein A2941_02425 [Candidatus Yanofskybacteria bacterium RIFCSPLOWO2_01_FULL_49_17]|uniref:Uncharacterized protein n=1 Tax=Candidatus Yanofskybacteria bacterium RIFCSPLOWO2_01_FULL_49_17 TaxID=1802700 RepID=A0A1F8GQP4_9BACT|nr:MAG: hypothetical protein A2941_02425 [Candidatus Yanofskybacteria bacterium RIFCSPLOWO2_01_FULL_49_17]